MKMELLKSLEEGEALGIAKIEKDIDELGPGTPVVVRLRGIITKMKE